MAGKQIEFVSGTITGVDTHGYVTLASVAGFYEGAIVWMNDSTATAPNNKQAIITEVDTTNVKLGICFRTNNAGEAPSYGRSSMSAYNGGSVTQHEQFIYNSDDNPLS